MTQRYANNARSRLVGALNNVATSFTIEAPTADLFPVADTTDWMAKEDWFKATLQKANGTVEIVYVGVRNLASGLFSNVLRGQEGTTAIAWDAGAIVGLRITALDVENALAGLFDELAIANAMSVGGDLSVVGNAVFTGTVSAATAVAPEDVPPLAQVTAIANSLVVQSDALAVDTIFSTAADVTVPTGFAGGKVLGIYNNSAVPIDIIQGGGLTLEYAGSVLTGNRILAAKGLMFMMTISDTKYSASGAGLL